MCLYSILPRRKQVYIGLVLPLIVAQQLQLAKTTELCVIKYVRKDSGYGRFQSVNVIVKNVRL